MQPLQQVDHGLTVLVVVYQDFLDLWQILLALQKMGSELQEVLDCHALFFSFVDKGVLKPTQLVGPGLGSHDEAVRRDVLQRYVLTQVDWLVGLMWQYNGLLVPLL